MSKVNCVCFGFRLVIGLKISRHFLSQSEVKPKPIVTRARTFSRASCRLHVFALSFDWFTELSVFFVIGWSNYFGLGFSFGFGFTTLNWKLLYTCTVLCPNEWMRDEWNNGLFLAWKEKGWAEWLQDFQNKTGPPEVRWLLDYNMSPVTLIILVSSWQTSTAP